MKKKNKNFKIIFFFAKKKKKKWFDKNLIYAKLHNKDNIYN